MEKKRKDVQNQARRMPRQKHSEDDKNEFYVDEWQMKRRRKQRQKELQASAKAKKQKEPMTANQRRIKNIIISSAILAAVIIVGAALSLTVLFNSDTITVEGSLHYSDDEIISASGLHLGENLFISDKAGGEKQIKEKFPYVESAKINVKIPSTFTIHITEAVPSYLVNCGSGYAVLSAKGRILEKAADRTSYNVPLLKGFSATDDNIGTYIGLDDANTKKILEELVEAINTCEFTGVTEIDLTNTADVALTYENRIDVIIGTPEDIAYKLKTAKIIIGEKLSATDAGTLDVSMCNTGEKKSYFKKNHTTEASTQSSAETTAAGETLPAAEKVAGIAGLSDTDSNAVYTPSNSNQQTTEPVYSTDYIVSQTTQAADNGLTQQENYGNYAGTVG